MEVATKIQVRDPITNRWTNSKVFCKEGIRFTEHGYYTTDPKGTISWKEYWDEQLKRCKEGYLVGGQKITGLHYEYLNFTQIKAVPPEGASEEDKVKVARKKPKNPDFWDGDYDYYWCLEIARNGIFNDNSLASTKGEKLASKSLSIEGRKDAAMRCVERLGLKVKLNRDFLDGGYHMIVGKSRRKGYSYKNAAICTNTYNTERQSLCIIAAFEKRYLFPTGTMGMCSQQLSFLNEHTAWSKAREYVDQQEHRRASFKKMLDGKPVESGYLSEIIGITCKDNPDALRGKDATYVLMEEGGAFPNLKATYNRTIPGLTAGSYITGQIIVFGTGGDMEGGTMDFAEMFYNPVEFGLMPFYNIWDENASETLCGFFHPVYMNMEGYYDENGNSDVSSALKHEMAVRDKIRKSATSSMSLQQRMQEHPTCPSEAFLMVSINDFPIQELRQQYNRVIGNNLHIILGQPVTLTPETYQPSAKEKVIDPFTKKPVEVSSRRRIKIIPDLNGKLEPIWTYKPKTRNLDGAVVIYEAPVPNPPKGLYKVGHDPYRQQSSSATLPSLASIYVYKTVLIGDSTKNMIVAEYVGRPYDPDDVNRILEMLCEMYNAEAMYENEVTHVKDYFKRRNKLHLLAAQPDEVISAAIRDSKVARVYGIHMVEKLKDAGEKYIKKWLLEERDTDENGNVLLNLHYIYDPALLEELILYNRKGNFDRVMGLMCMMFQLAEEDEGMIHKMDSKDDVVEQLIQLMDRQFRNDYYETMLAS